MGVERECSVIWYLTVLFFSVIGDDDMRLPDCTDLISSLRRSKDYKLFCSTILRKAYGEHRWRKKERTHDVQAIVRPSFESFVLLAYENCYGTFKDCQSVDQIPAKKNFKYTGDKSRCARNKGWGLAAIDRYNEFHSRIVEDRRINKCVDEEFFKETQERLCRKRKRVDVQVEEEVRLAVNDIGEVTDWEGV